jgi:site-specific recombinase XerD
MSAADFSICGWRRPTLPIATWTIRRELWMPFWLSTQSSRPYLEHDEIDAVLKTINRTTVPGSRDYALLAMMFNTGGRVQEIADLRVCDLQLTKPFQVRLFGKGRKERYCPLWPQTAAVLRAFCHQRNLGVWPTAA